MLIMKQKISQSFFTLFLLYVVKSQNYFDTLEGGAVGV